MGAVCSCLGGGRRDDYEEDEEQRLLNGDETIAGQYGSLGDPGLLVEDGTEARQEAEALQRMVAKTTDNMVDVYEIGDNPRPVPTPFAYAGQHDRLMRYQTLLSRIADNKQAVEAITIETVTVDEGPVELGTVREPKGTTDRALVGTFADAAAAMK